MAEQYLEGTGKTQRTFKGIIDSHSKTYLKSEKGEFYPKSIWVKTPDMKKITTLTVGSIKNLGDINLEDFKKVQNFSLGPRMVSMIKFADKKEDLLKIIREARGKPRVPREAKATVEKVKEISIDKKLLMKIFDAYKDTAGQYINFLKKDPPPKDNESRSIIEIRGWNPRSEIFSAMMKLQRQFGSNRIGIGTNPARLWLMFPSMVNNEKLTKEIHEMFIKNIASTGISGTENLSVIIEDMPVPEKKKKSD